MVDIYETLIKIPPIESSKFIHLEIQLTGGSTNWYPYDQYYSYKKRLRPTCFRR